MTRTPLRLRRGFAAALVLALPAALLATGPQGATASQPGTTTLNPRRGTAPSVTWTGSFALTGRLDPAIPCEAAQRPAATSTS